MDDRSRRARERFRLPVLIAALLVVPVVVIDASSVSPTWRDVGDVLNWLTWVVFAAEFVTLLVYSPNKRRWLREHPLDVVIVC
jgi:voltage-gated potassium channel